MQSTLHEPENLHVAAIMDGNGRWATRRGLPRSIGHRAGVETVRRVIECAAELNVATLTLFAFSSDNWRRPPDEIDTLMWLLRGYLRADVRRFAESGARLTVIGRRDRLPARLRREIRHAEQATAEGRRIHVRIALDYSSRHAIACAAARAAGPPPASPDDFGRVLSRFLAEPGCDTVDLLIRTGGEKRLSDFLLWECAYAELFFTDTMWPDFGADELKAILADFRRRERRFGGLNAARPVAAVAAE